MINYETGGSSGLKMHLFEIQIVFVVLAEHMSIFLRYLNALIAIKII